MNKEPADFEFSHYENNYSEEGFWDKIKAIAKKAGTRIVYTALKLYYAAQSPDTPAWAKTVIFGALGYLILPVDVIPDVLPGIGFTDDLAMMVTALSLITSNITDSVKERALAKMKEWFSDIDIDIEDLEDNIDEQ